VRNRLDLAFESLGELTLKNIARPVEAFVLRFGVSVAASKPAGSHSAAELGHLPLPNKPSVAVLAFRNASADPDQEYFSDGIAEDVITELSRSRSLFVIARNSSFTYKGRDVDIRQVGRELGVRYVLEGSVRRAGPRVRVTAQLVEAASANHIWAEHFDRDLADIFTVQDEITAAVSRAIEPAIADAEQQRVARKPPESLGAWEAYQRGMWHHAKSSASENRLALEFFRRAVELDKTFSPAYQGVVHAYVDDAILYFVRSPQEAAELADPFARKAVVLDPSDAGAYIALNYVAFARGDINASLAIAEQALALNPNSASANWARSGSLVYIGRFDESAEASRTFLRLSPRDPRAFRVMNHQAIGRYMLGDYAGSIDAARQALRANPDQSLSYRWLVASLGQLGRVEEARAVIRAAAPRVAPVSFDLYATKRGPWLREQDHARLLEGLRKAGVASPAP
jgi:adenylate cyclase